LDSIRQIPNPAFRATFDPRRQIVFGIIEHEIEIGPCRYCGNIPQ
jgi:hypothetical protein